jgi:hypothetical protein
MIMTVMTIHDDTTPAVARQLYFSCRMRVVDTANEMDVVWSYDIGDHVFFSRLAFAGKHGANHRFPWISACGRPDHWNL